MLDLAVNSSIVKLFEQLKRFGASDGRVRYDISGSLGLEGHGSAIPFEQEGEIDMRPSRPIPGRTA